MQRLLHAYAVKLSGAHLKKIRSIRGHIENKYNNAVTLVYSKYVSLISVLCVGFLLFDHLFSLTCVRHYFLVTCFS